MRTALLFGAVAAAGIGISTAPVAFAAVGPSAEFTIAQLQAQGFDVKVSKVGSAPLNECVVTDIGDVRERTKLVRRGDDLVQVVVSRAVNVTVTCPR